MKLGWGVGCASADGGGVEADGSAAEHQVTSHHSLRVDLRVAGRIRCSHVLQPTSREGERERERRRDGEGEEGGKREKGERREASTRKVNRECAV